MSKITIQVSNRSDLNILKHSTFESTFHDTKNSLPISPLSEKTDEFFLVDDSVLERQEEDMLIFSSDDYSFLRITHGEKKYENLENASYQAFKKIFDFMSENTHLNFLRAWNYVPEILKIEGLERYREFNLGRWKSWEEHGPKFEDGKPMRPAMTAIGSLSDPLIVEALFTRHPVVYLENPRQKQFIDYSNKWGPKPPISARGTLHLVPGSPEVFIAGTASLLGEEVAHEGDIEEQVRETLRNIGALISKENLLNYGHQQGFDLNDLQGIRAYIKNPETDFSRAQSILEKQFPNIDILYLHDDICRPGFLIEIEAIARRGEL